MPSPWKVSPSPSFSARISSVNWRSMEHASQEKNHTIEKAGILDNLGPVERGAKDRRMRVLAAQAAADAAVDDGRDRVASQRIGVVLHGERRAARQADARVVAGARVFVHAVFHAYGSLSFGKVFCDDRPQFALALELALALGDDDLEALVLGAHRLLE